MSLRKITTPAEMKDLPEKAILLTKEERALQITAQIKASDDRFLRDALTQHGPFLVVWEPVDVES